MKIGNIEKKDGIYFVTKTPNFIQRLFGVKEKVERYRYEGEVFYYFNDLKVFYDSNGKKVSWDTKMCRALNDYEHSF